MKKQSNRNSCVHAKSAIFGNAQIADTQYLRKINQQMTDRIAATQLLIEALKKKMAMQDCMYDGYLPKSS